MAVNQLPSVSVTLYTVTVHSGSFCFDRVSADVDANCNAYFQYYCGPKPEMRLASYMEIFFIIQFSRVK